MVPEVLNIANYRFSPYALPPLATGLAVLLLGLVVLTRVSRTRTSLSFFLVSLSISFWLLSFSLMYCTLQPAVALWWARAAYLGIVFIPGSCVTFACMVLNQEKRYRTAIILCWLLSLPFLPAAFFSDRFITSVESFFWGYYPQYGWIGTIFLIFFVLMTGLSLWTYWHFWRHSTAGSREEKKAQVFFLAFALAYLGGIDFFAKYGLEIYPCGFVPIFVFCLMCARAILLDNLVDITPAYAAKSIIETMREALFVLDEKGVVRLTNKAAALLLCKDESEIVGMTLQDCFILPFPAHQLFDKVKTEKRSIIGIKGKGEALSGMEFELSLSPLFGRSGNITAAVCLLHDLSEQNKIRMELETANQLLEERVRRRTLELEEAHKKLRQSEKLCAIGKLSASIAHEFGSPIFAIRNLLEGMRRDNPATTDGELIQLGIEECNRLKDMLANLRDFYAPTAFSLHALDLNQLIDEVLQFFGVHLQEKGIRLVRNLHPVLPKMHGSRDQLKQVLLNLLQNASEAIVGEGTIDITTDYRDGQILLHISDSGLGVDAKIIDHLFEPFTTTKDCATGTGLGLSISYGIIRGHGGDISLHSDPGTGTVFSISLPCGESIN